MTDTLIPKGGSRQVRATSSSAEQRRPLPALRGVAVGIVWLFLTAASSGRLPAETWEEDFSAAPSETGWRLFGEESLFRWNAMRQLLEVTWDSRQPNSYLYRPLGTILTKQDDFSIEFELRLDDIMIGVDSNKLDTFELAIGLNRIADATSTNFFRGAGQNPLLGPRNLVEFDYFPDYYYGATLAPTVVSTNSRIVFSDNHPLELTPGDLYRVAMVYSASNQVLHTRAWRNGEPFGMYPGPELADIYLTGFPDFRVDTLAVSSYSDEGQTPPQYAGSILAHGTVDNLRVSVPDGPIQGMTAGLSNGLWQVCFESQPAWFYTLERSTNLASWEPVSSTSGEDQQRIAMEDPSAPSLGQSFYRVRAERP